MPRNKNENVHEPVKTQEATCCKLYFSKFLQSVHISYQGLLLLWVHGRPHVAAVWLFRFIRLLNG